MKLRSGSLSIVVFVIFFMIFSISTLAVNEQVYQEEVTIKYAAPGSNPAKANGFEWTVSEGGKYQVKIKPDKPEMTINAGVASGKVGEIIDIGLGFLLRTKNGPYKRDGKEYNKSEWEHGTGSTYVESPLPEGEELYIYYSSSIGGAPCPDINGTVTIRRIK